MALEQSRHWPPLRYCVELQLQLVDENRVKLELQRVQSVALVQVWQLDITVEHVTQVPDELLRYCVAVHDVQVAPLLPLAQRVQNDELVHVWQSVIAEEQSRQEKELR